MIARWRMFNIIIYVIEKIKNGAARAEAEGAVSQQDAEQQLAKWIRE